MTPLLNWLALITFAVASIPFAHWVVSKSLERWTGPKTMASFAFLYAMTIAAIAGLTFAAISVLFQKILYQPDFIQPLGTLKFLLMFSGVWYGMIVMAKAKKDADT
jgi:protein-S-isoprenylcysteine O-methyltransferase Ste14